MASPPPLADRRGALGEIEEIFATFYRQGAASPPEATPGFSFVAIPQLVRGRLAPWMAVYAPLQDITLPEIEQTVARRRAHLERELREPGPLFWPPAG